MGNTGKIAALFAVLLSACGSPSGQELLVDAAVDQLAAVDAHHDAHNVDAHHADAFHPDAAPHCTGQQGDTCGCPGQPCCTTSGVANPYCGSASGSLSDVACFVDGASNTCLHCGGKDEPCCGAFNATLASRSCESGYHCYDFGTSNPSSPCDPARTDCAVCHACGGLHQPCCLNGVNTSVGNGCDGTLSCHQSGPSDIGTCEP